jgi:beta-galactosidase
MTAFAGKFPWLTAWCGDIDIIGVRRPQSYYREIVFGLRAAPYIGVLRPEHHGRFVRHASPWAFSDVASSWTWPGYETRPVQVEVYSDADEVELLVNSRSCGRRPAGPAHNFRAIFEACYEPGRIEAVAWRDGTAAERTILRSAEGPVQVSLHVDRHEIADSTVDAAFVEIRLVDEAGELHRDADRVVRVTVTGAGALQGLASANPRSEDPFTATACRTYEGRALAVVRPTGAGLISVTVEADACPPQQIAIQAVAERRETDS